MTASKDYRYRAGQGVSVKTAASRTVVIEREPIELCRILKVADMVQSGGEAKLVIARGLVQVNDVVETRKRKKILAGDQVAFDGETILVSLRQ